MNQETRNCVFTNLPATHKLTITSTKHNWTKSVPCTKEVFESKKNKKLSDIEFKIIEYFYLKEMALLRVEYLDNKMEELRKMLNLEDYARITLQDIEIVNIDLEQAKSLTEYEEPAKIITPTKNIWE